MHETMQRTNGKYQACRIYDQPIAYAESAGQENVSNHSTSYANEYIVYFFDQIVLMNTAKGGACPVEAAEIECSQRDIVFTFLPRNVPKL